jgi:dienelactone hydrolase
LPGPGGTRLSAESIGSGTIAVVFLHEAGGQGRCGFWPYASWLSHHYAVRSVLVDRCGYGASTCDVPATGDAGLAAETQPAVDWAHAHGASRVAIIGASTGGSDALEAAGAVEGIQAVVDLSGDGTDTGQDEAIDQHAARDRLPTLFVLAPGDPFVAVADMRRLYVLVPAAHKQFVVATAEPGEHGWDLLLSGADEQPTPIAKQVAEWIRAALP